MSKKILTVEEQKHLYLSIADIFNDATEEDIASIISRLGLSSVVDEGGNLVPVYSLNITSNKPTYVIDDYNIRLKAKAFNYFADITDQIQSWQWSRDSGNTGEDNIWAQGKTSEFLDLTEQDFSSRFEERDIVFSLKVILVNGTTLEDTIEFTRVQTFNSVQISLSSGLFVEGTPSDIFAQAITDFQVQSYRWYIDDVFASVGSSYSLPFNHVPLGGAVNLKVEATDMRGSVHTDTISIPRLENGTPGEPGVPGPPGPGGESSYTWIKYADGPNGEGMNEYPIRQDGSAREYIGLAPNKSSPIESENPADYTWSRYIGEDGVPGENGYMWIKYSKWENGRDTNGTPDMFDEPFIIIDGHREDMLYMGIAYNKQVQQEADQNTPEGAPENYIWSRIRGEDGHTGYILELSNDNTSVPSEEDGTIPNPSVAFNHVKTDAVLYYGNDIVPISEFGLVLTQSAGVTYSTTNDGMSVQIVGMTEDVGSILFEAYPRLPDNSLDLSDKIASATFTLTKVKNTSVYEIMPNTSAFISEVVYNNGVPSEELSPDYLFVEILKNTGSSITFITEGVLTYRYLFENNLHTDNDGTQMSIGQNMNVNTQGDPLFIELKYFHPVSNQLVDKERIPFVRDGLPGNFTEFRYKVEQSSGTTVTLTPTQKTTPDLSPHGWLLTPGTPPSGGMLWMIQAQKKPNGDLLGEWSDPIPFTGEQGISGTTGMIPRLMEWIVGSEYEIGGKYIDYVYFRTSDENHEGWYTVKIPPGQEGGRIVATANSGLPDSNLFKKEPFTNNAQFGTIIAEQANLAGFIFRNQQLTSQGQGTQTCEGVVSTYPNLTIDGNQGIIKFLEKVHFDKEGIRLRDDCGNDRMIFMWSADGVPLLQFLDENNNVVWEAGKSGYQYIVTGTVSPTWGPNVGLRKVTALNGVGKNDVQVQQTDYKNVSVPTGYSGIDNFKVLSNTTISNSIKDQATNPSTGELFAIQRVDCQGQQSTKTPYYAVYKNNAFGAHGNVKMFNKGDMAEYLDKYVAYYNSNTTFAQTITVAEIPTLGSSRFVPDGWYFMEGGQARNFQGTTVCNASSGVVPFMHYHDGMSQNVTGTYPIKMIYMENGNIVATRHVMIIETWEYDPLNPGG